MAKTKQKKNLRYGRVYYGFTEEGEPAYWDNVIIKKSKKTVYLKGSMLDALLGMPGIPANCTLSECSKRQREAFPHKIIYPSFTGSRAVFIDEWRNGKAYSAVEYTHKLGDLVNLNDVDKEKKFIKDHPELIERELVLYKTEVESPRVHTGKSGASGAKYPLGHPKSQRVMVPRGALKRAEKAGLIPRRLANLGIEE